MALGLGFVFAVWLIWSETQPDEERALRVATYDWLGEQFPEEMSLQDGWHGLRPRNAIVNPHVPRILLVHGLDEAGNIWDDLVPELTAAQYPVVELRYPNDQAIERNTAYLASLWSQIPAEQPVVMIGHSMGGLVIRDFITSWRQPVGQAAKVAGAPVLGAILVGTPNHGSPLARMRVVLEARGQVAEPAKQEADQIDWFAKLRDGTGAAKIDLRSDSSFLTRLNQQPWPADVKLQLIIGVLAENEAVNFVGDGAVSLDSALLPDLVAQPYIVVSTHRGLLRRYFPTQAEPPAIPIIMQLLQQWSTATS